MISALDCDADISRRRADFKAFECQRALVGEGSILDTLVRTIAVQDAGCARLVN